MFRYLISILFISLLLAIFGSYFLFDYWIHRYDNLIERQASVYHLDPDFVWSVIYEETFFRNWKRGADEEVGLMQVTPVVAREWAKATGIRELERQAKDDVVGLLKSSERNIQIGCWYLEKLREEYRALPAEEAMTLAAYNAGASRVEEWTKDGKEITESDFLERINIASTKLYVISILERYRAKKSKSALTAK